MKYLSMGLILFLPTLCSATQMCIKPDMFVRILDPQDNGTVGEYTYTGGMDYEKKWSANFSYGTVSGIGACGDGTGDIGRIATNQDALDPTVDKGQPCYCKMLKPTVSLWVYSGEYANRWICARNCATKAAQSFIFRRSMYNSIKGI